MTVAVLGLLSTGVFSQPIELPAELPVSGVEYAPFGENFSPLIIANGSGFLALWNDVREPGRVALYAARIDANGVVLDPTGVRIAYGGTRSAIWTGERYLIDAGLELGKRAILSLDADLTLRDQFFISADLGASSFATNGTDVFMATAMRTGLRLDRQGRVIESVALDTTSTPDAASNGDGYLVVWGEGSTLYAQPSGGARVTVASDLASGLAIESDGSSYLIVYGTDAAIHAQVVDANGAPLFPRQTVAGRGSSLDLAWRNGEYVFTYMIGNQMFDARLNARGELVRDAIRLGYGHTFNVATAGERAGFIWRDMEVGAIRALIGDTPVNVSVAPNRQEPPQLVNANGSVIALWQEKKQLRIAALGGESQVVGELGWTPELLFDGNLIWVVWATADNLHVRRYSPSLVPFDAAPIELDAPMINGTFTATAGTDGVLVSWEHNGVQAIVLRANGTAIDATRLEFDGEKPVTAWSGSEYAVAWIEQTGPIAWAINVVRITRDGLLVDPIPVVAAENTYTRELFSLRAATAIGGGVVLGWMDDSGTYAAHFRGDSRPPVSMLRDTPKTPLELIVVANDRYLFFWTRPYVQRVSAALETEGETFVIPGVGTAFDVVTLGDRLFLGYAREVSHLGGVTRAFVRHNMTAARRRAVR